MRLFSVRPFLLVALLAAILGVGCSGDAPTEEQVLNTNLTAEPQSLDPQRATDAVSLSVLEAIYSGLLRLSPDLELEADVASEVPTVENGGISEDGLTYTFHLRDDLKWSDGTPLVAQAFVDGARHLFEPGSGNRYVDFYRVIAATGSDGDANLAVEEALAAGVEGDPLAALERAVVDGLQVEAPDDQTVVYRLNRPSPVFLLLTTMWPLYPIRQDVLEASGDQWTEAGTLVSNGPFTLAQWDHSEFIQLARNEHWHSDDVSLATINMDMIEDPAVAFLAYQNDELDLVSLGPAELAQVRGDEGLREEFLSYARLSTNGVYLNTSNEYLMDVRVRQALAGGLDREEFAEAVTGGAVLAGYGWVPPGMPGHDADAGAQYRDAIEASQALLEDAGHGDGSGVTLRLLTPDQGNTVATAEWLKQQWETNLGVTIEIDVRETATYVAERNAGSFDIVIGGWGTDYPDPQNWFTQFRSGAGLNSTGFSDPEYDALVDEADLRFDLSDRLGLYADAQEILLEQAPVIPMYYGRRNVLVKPWVQGLVGSSLEHQVPGDMFFEQVEIDGRP